MDYLKQIEEKFKNKTYKEKEDIIKDYIIFDKQHLGTSGVYLIEDFYIGRTKNIYSRIVSHIIEVLEVETTKIVHNKEKLYLLWTILKKRRLKVKLLDKNQNKEPHYIRKLYNKLPLVNVEFVTIEMAEKRRYAVKNRVRGKIIEIKIEDFTSRFKVSKVDIKGLNIFQVAKNEKYARLNLKNYLDLKPKKTIKGEKEKDIKEYKYVTLSAGKIKIIFNQLEKWQEELKKYKKPKIKGFDSIINARVYLFGNKAEVFEGET